MYRQFDHWKKFSFLCVRVYVTLEEQYVAFYATEELC